MILNTNSLPFPLSPGLRTIILKHIADSFMACVLNFRPKTRRGDEGGSGPVEIAVDTDGSLIYISESPSDGAVTGMHFDFSRDGSHRLDTLSSLNRERERFQEWEHTFVGGYLRGGYEVDAAPLIELDEIVTAG
ncbi:MAG TPA: hypothetical protein VF799_05090 [Geobacteraceae bacterium]